MDKITWTNEKRKLSELIPWPRNPRQIKGDQAKRLVESFDQFGQVETIAIGPGNEVYNGHQRLNVLANKYGKDYEVEVRVSSRPLEEKEREKLTVFLHKGAAGEWDFDTLANEFELDDLLEWGFESWELGNVLGDNDYVDKSERAGSSPWSRVDGSDKIRCLIGDLEFGINEIAYERFETLCRSKDECEAWLTNRLMES
jgi:hypothetical protein